MNILLNGESKQTKCKTVSELLNELDIRLGRVAVEVNLQIIRKTDYESHQLSEGDIVEIVNFVGGG
ncbi:MAG TPA: sulfur carrier protein ThiS [Dissulfurispiraceae bacterium]|nr:sulfur carrier protein ThiS [Dissulfurispiraceae bacterium]